MKLAVSLLVCSLIGCSSGVMGYGGDGDADVADPEDGDAATDGVDAGPPAVDAARPAADAAPPIVDGGPPVGDAAPGKDPGPGAGGTPVVDTPPNARFCEAQGPFSSDLVVAGELSSSTDVDTFRLEIARPGRLRAFTDDGAGGCRADTKLFIYQAECDCHAMDRGSPPWLDKDDDGGPDFCSNLDVEVSPGTYFLRVRAGGAPYGPYRLVVDLP